MKQNYFLKFLIFLLAVCASWQIDAQTYTFTTSGASGRTGPTQAQIDAAYSATSLDGQVTINTQGIQEWTVPQTGSYTLMASGASGGVATNYNNFQGLGAIISGEYNLTEGQVLKIVVGQEGGSGFGAGAGGGGSYIVRSDNSPLIVAGGGGGQQWGGPTQSYQHGSIGTSGQNTYYVNGGVDGFGGGGDNGSGASGGGGLLGDGGNGSWGSPGLSFYNGSIGGGSSTTALGGFGGGGGTHGNSGGGGGGGGYSGGAGGRHDAIIGNGGGGGSYNNGTNQVNTAGANTGNGEVVITLLCDELNVTVTPSTNVCPGTMVTITGTSNNGGDITWDNGITNGEPFEVTAGMTFTSTSTSSDDCVEVVEITVEDNDAPTAITQDITVELDENGQATIEPSQINNGSSDNCTADADLIFSLDRTNFDCSDLENSNFALDFDGVDDYVSISNPYYQFNNEITVSWWVNFKGDSAFMTQSTENVDNMSTNVWLMHSSNSNGVTWYVNDGGTWRSVSGNSTSGWHLVTGVANASVTKLYIDGAEVGSTGGITSGIVNNSNSVIHIGKDGRYPTTSGRVNNFAADDVIIYNKALAPSEIESLKTDVPNLNDPNLKGYWNFNEANGDVVNDLSTTNAQGNLINMNPAIDWVSSGTTVIEATVVTLTVTDKAGNKSTAIASVIVEDNTAPTITCPGNMQVDNDPGVDGAIIQFPFNNSYYYTSTDNGSKLAKINLENGTTTIIGSFGYSQTFTIAFTPDGKAWTIVNSNQLASVDLSTGIATPIGSSFSFLSYNLDSDSSGQLYVLGSSNQNLYKINSTNGSTELIGNTGLSNVMDIGFDSKDKLWAINSTKKLYSVNTITGNSTLETNIDPEINSEMGLAIDQNDKFYLTEFSTSPKLFELDPNSGQLVLQYSLSLNNPHGGDILNDIEVSDNCSIASFQQTAGLPSGSEFPIGTTTNTFEVTDTSGNKTTCSFDVIVKDVEAPKGYTVSIDQSEIDETNETAVSFTFTAAEVGTTYNYTFSSENGGTKITGTGTITTATDQITGIDISGLEDGTITLSVTLTDEADNEGLFATDTIVKNTNEAPVAVCKAYTAELDASGNVTIAPEDVDGGSTDDKEGFTLSLDIDTFDCSNIGTPVTVTLTITDSDNVTDTCLATITVEDNEAPTAIAQNVTVQLDEYGKASIKGDYFVRPIAGELEPQNSSSTPTPVDCDCPEGYVAVGYEGATGWILDDFRLLCKEVLADGSLSAETVETCFSGSRTLVYRKDILTGNEVLVGFEIQDGDYESQLSSRTHVSVKGIGKSLRQIANGEVNNIENTMLPGFSGSGTATTNLSTTTQFAPAGNAIVGMSVNQSTGYSSTVSFKYAPISSLLSVDNGSSDNCGIASMSVSPDSFTCSEVGENTVTLTVIDNNGNESTTTSTVTVEDNIAPVAVAKDITVQLDETGNIAIVAADVDNGSADACGIASMSVSPDSFTCSEVGENTVTLTVIDNNGNESTTTSTVTVEDNVAAIAVAKDITVQLEETGNVAITAEDVDNGSADACGIASMSVSPNSFTCAEVGENTVTLTVIDNNGNESIVTSIVTVEDNVAAVAVAKDITVQLDETGNIAIVAADVDNGSADACGIASMSVSPNSFTCSEVGENTVTLTVIDNNGNESIVTSIVTVEDNVAAVAVAKDITVQLDETGNIAIVAADVDNGSADACGIASMSVSPNSFTCSEVGENTVTLTVIDNNGNESTTTSTVTVEDNVAAIAVAKDITVQLDETGNVAITAEAIDNGSADACGIASMSVSPNSFTCAEVGDNTVTLTLIDNNGNESTTTSIVTVEDNVAAVAVAKDITVQLDETGNVSITAEDVDNGSADACGIKSLSVSPNSFTCAEVGKNTVTLTVVDNNGNESTITSTVTVEDNVAAVAVAKDITVQLDETGNVSITAEDVDNGSADACGIKSLSVSPNSFTCAEVGKNTVTLTVVDNNGNESTITSTVTVEDNVAAVTVAKDITVQLDETGNVVITAEDVDNGSADACGIASISVSPNSFTCAEVGDNTVTLTLIDNNGNESTATSTVTVEDNIKPVPSSSVLEDIIAECSVEEADVQVPTATDNCNGTVKVTNNVTFPITASGLTTITWSFEDAYGNVSTQTQNVIIKDETAPVPDVAELSDIVVECSIENINIPTATDNCGGIVTATTNDALAYTEPGEYMILWEFADGSGNTSTQEQWVTVKDISAPVVNTEDITISIFQNETITISPEDVNDGTLDNCSDVTLSLDQDTFDVPGVYTVTLSATDATGNVGSATAIVTVKRGIPDAKGEMHVVPSIITGTTMTKVIAPLNSQIYSIQILETETNKYKTISGNKQQTMMIDVAPMRGTLLVRITDQTGKVHLKKIIVL